MIGSALLEKGTQEFQLTISGEKQDLLSNVELFSKQYTRDFYYRIVSDIPYQGNRYDREVIIDFLVKFNFENDIVFQVKNTKKFKVQYGNNTTMEDFMVKECFNSLNLSDVNLNAKFTEADILKEKTEEWM